VKVVQAWPGAVFVPPVSLKLDLDAAGEQRTKLPRADASGGRKAGWWTARATTGEVTPGFTKEEILRVPSQNPRAEGGVFGRLEALLAELAGPQ
jgi:hypothetical protein